MEMHETENLQSKESSHQSEETAHKMEANSLPTMHLAVESFLYEELMNKQKNPSNK